MPSKHVHSCTSSVYHLLLQFISLCVTLWKWFRVGVNSKRLQDGRLAIKTTSTRELNCYIMIVFPSVLAAFFICVSSLSGYTHTRPFHCQCCENDLFYSYTCALQTSSDQYCTEFVSEKECQFLYSVECVRGAGFFFCGPVHSFCQQHVRSTLVLRALFNPLPDLNVDVSKISTVVPFGPWLNCTHVPCWRWCLVMFMLPVFLATFCASLPYRTKALQPAVFHVSS